MYFDSHAHLDDARFQPDFDDILARMRENGVTGMMNVGCDLPSSERSVALAERYDWIWAAVGSHPDDADLVDAARIARYRALCQNPACAPSARSGWIITMRISRARSRKTPSGCSWRWRGSFPCRSSSTSVKRTRTVCGSSTNFRR